jgi:Cytochrome c556
MKLKLVFATTTVLCLGIGAAIAAGEPQVVRQEMMKDVGKAMGAIGAIAKGEKPFDVEVIRASLQTMAEVGKTFPDHFPAGSESGFETEATPAVWEKPEEFKDKSAALVTAAEGQLAQLPADQAGVGAVMKAVGSTCGACHETFRVKKN